MKTFLLYLCSDVAVFRWNQRFLRAALRVSDLHHSCEETEELEGSSKTVSDSENKQDHLQSFTTLYQTGQVQRLG